MRHGGLPGVLGGLGRRGKGGVWVQRVKNRFLTSVCLSVGLSLLPSLRSELARWLGRGLRTLGLSAFGAIRVSIRHRAFVQDSGQAFLG